jgi:hypothetical protein
MGGSAGLGLGFWFRLGGEEIEFLSREGTPGAGGEFGIEERAHAHAAQALHFVSEAIKHEADLALEPLFKHDSQDLRAHDSD